MNAIRELRHLDALVGEPAVQAIVWALLQFVWQGALIGLLAAATLAALRRSAADVRYVVASIALSLMLTVPVVTAVQGIIAARRAAPDAASLTLASAGEPTLPAVAQTAAVLSRTAPRAGSEPIAAGASQRASTSSRWGVEAFAPWLILGWTAGVLVLTLRLLSGWIWVQRLKTHGASPARASLHAIGERLARRLHISRPVRLLESSLIDVPTVVGWMKPIVLLPVSALAGLSPVQLEAILAHELAHIRRHDYLVNLLQTLVETLLFYHPAVWWVSRQIRIERENCCDDLAVSLCGDPVVYAQALADLEQLRGSAGQLVMAASGGSLLHRVRRLLGAPSHAGRGPGWLAGAVALVLVVAMAGMTASAIRSEAPRSERPVRRSATHTDRVARTTAGPADEIRHAANQIRQDANELRRGANELRRGANEFRRGANELARGIQAFTRALANEASAVVDALRHSFPQIPPMPPLPPDPLRSAAEPPSLPEPSSVLEPSWPPVPPVLPAPPALPVPPAPPELAAPPALPATPQLPAAPELRAPPALPAAPAVPVPFENLSLRGQKSGTFTWSRNGEKLEVDYRGDIEFTDDDTDVKSLSPGGRLRISDGTRQDGHTVEFRADESGRIERRFWSGTSERPFEPEGRKWLTQVLPRFIRQTGIGAPARVTRIYRTKGVRGVLSEISLVEGSWAKRIYFTELLKIPGLDARAVQDVLAQAGREIDSDFELASLLISTDRLVIDDSSRKAYLDAARSIQSDFEMRRVLSSTLKKGPMSPSLMAALLDTSTSIESDFEQASLLVDVAKLQPLDDTTRAPFFKALATVDSDFEHRRVLSEVLRRADLSPTATVAALESAGSIGSDFEIASVLLEVAGNRPMEGSLRGPFFRAVSSIGSSFERGRVLQAVAKRTDVSDQTILDVIKATEDMSGSFESAQVLLSVAARRPLTREARDAYIDAAGKLGEFEQGRVLAALVKNERQK